MNDPSPALVHQAPDYPAEWQGRVPSRVIILKTSKSDDSPFEMLLADLQVGRPARLAAFKDIEYPVWVNSHGAVAVIFPGGDKLGVKPGEFKVIDWHERNA